MIRFKNLMRAYFAAWQLLAFGALCFVAGIATTAILAIGMMRAAQ